MSENINYKEEIVKRTKDLLETKFEGLKNDDREVTFLMNCLLGLIIAVSEKEKETPIFNKIDNRFSQSHSRRGWIH